MLHTLILILAAAAANDPAAVTELRIEPVAGYTEVVVRTSGEVGYSDFLLTEPPRLIVDLKGARHALGRANFEDIRRGGVVRVRTSQFRDDVVRIVVELTEPTSYTLTRQGSEIRVSFPNPEGMTFDSWASRREDTAPAAAPTPVPLPEAAEARPTPRRTQQQQQQTTGTFRQEQTPVSQMPRITVTFENTDIRDVLNNFADFTGKSFVPGSGVEGTVTANIRNQPWDLALKAILDAQGLTAVETGTGIIRVDRLENLQERQQLVQLQTQIFKINYAPVTELAQAIQPAISDRGKIIANEATNSIIVTDLEENLEITQQLITDLDVRTPQVVISAKIIFVDRSDIEELGIAWDLKDTGGNQLNELNPGPSTDPRDWELVDADFDGVPETVVKPLSQVDQLSFSGSSVAALANARERLVLPALQLLTSAALGDFRLFTFIEALERQDLSDIVAAPTIQTMDNQAADILVGERTPIRIVDYGAGGAAGGGQAGQAAQAQFPQSTVQLQETGIKLEVTPHITHDRRIVLDLHAERSGVQVAPGDIGFVFQTQEGNTRLILADGETGVIGGLTVSEVTETESGIPILMDLPLVGGLFRTRRSDEGKQDLLILVTPHIVDEAVSSN
ncbi:MAG: AMIN domain-containing protein [Gemmatimonadetes bacterium]|nr:AMIN domain-containing protein [Gemmatimonadota bacterium]NIV25507.1 AMIN domain-containing protein [Gemmatimonadota bacterium]NIW38052.1 AMIN domain-containing protein [Gemmatimonadota bacterium]NIW77580.1 AMIN domain-containing protein [Gemmatimonadota bacterium]NIY45571.1 AMIN domain-containing protein [Gemmatimonadota bacterium]